MPMCSVLCINSSLYKLLTMGMRGIIIYITLTEKKSVYQVYMYLLKLLKFIKSLNCVKTCLLNRLNKNKS